MRLGVRLLAAVAVVLVTGSVPAAAEPGAAGADPVVVTLDRSEASIGLGQTLRFSSEVRNSGEQDVAGVIAHLNVFAVDPGVYVDPEDWSGERTQYLEPLGGGEAESLEWELQAVNSGRFVVYVALSTDQPAAPVTSSKSLRLSVAQERTLDTSGAVPVAAGVPAVVALLMGLVMVRRRRHRPNDRQHESA
ncbi:hypothetical protein Kfla_3509 [Kribbella flavida DSM 17836]|uniref:DUF11 domain-containing protein n=1 Tax=Kribbella flavida (strain DSM 17836 / JCM 10339 / NBRC 14399) TaxID=479435 RepID=D2PLY7_KRIFD|nr:hypothetical protein [Kribbella flavida]ADB32567.1 hypothetical protein Kfla_3509 [Kribbella flavida DSM 17836]